MPTTDAYGQGVQIASLTDPPDAATLANAIVDGLVVKSVMQFTSASNRSATITSPVEGMASWLMDVNRFEVYNGSAWVTPPPVVTTTASGATASPGFDVVSLSGRKISGFVAMVNAAYTRTGATLLADADGNITDVSIGTLPSGWRPPETVYTSIGDGFGNGDVSVDSTGLIVLRSWSGGGGIVATRNLRFTLTFVPAT
ncbi:hypothetical protein [Streptomyces flavidovirens]